jgi:hypothetical protein
MRRPLKGRAFGRDVDILYIFVMPNRLQSARDLLFSPNIMRY